MLRIAEDAWFKRASDQSLLVYLGSEISLPTHQRVIKLLRLLEREPIAGVRDLHPAYCSLLINFDLLQLRHDDLEAMARSYLGRLDDETLPEPRRIEIPVCYEENFSPDLGDVCATLKMTAEQVIALHGSVEYVVYFLGFVPGFAYLGELPTSLEIPRLPSPRRAVPHGSVGIAGNQTGVYPFATPGGWRLIGRTPVQMFRGGQNAESLLSIGDRVRFVPITTERFAELENS
ncbi:MAG TPA: 5-oxoprolinase subunit PxpB [Terriglobales bacterium]|jgi:inhibitor of KinA